MIRAIADTHALIWYLFDDKRLSHPAKQQFMDTPRPTTKRRAFAWDIHMKVFPSTG